MLYTTPSLFDGEHPPAAGWLRVDHGRVVETGTGPAPGDDPAAAEYPALLPALVDAHCHVTGYLEYPGADEPYAPHRAFLGLLREAGVGAVRDLGNHAETADNLAALPDAPVVRGTGPVIDEPPGRVAYSRLVSDEDTARSAVRRAAAAGAAWVKTYSGLRSELLATVVSEAAEHGLPVAHRPGRTDALTAARLGVASLEHLPLCLPAGPRPASAGQLVRSWAAPEHRGHADRLVGELAAAGVAVTPLLLAWRRAALLDDAVAEPRLQRLVPITPYHRYLEQMRGPGLAFGRRYARRYLGYEHLKPPARAEFDTGWRVLLETLARLSEAGVALLPGTDAPGISMVPGFALHEELAVWEGAGLARPAVLAAATGGNAGALGLGRWSAGVLAASRDPFTAATVAAGLAGAELLVPPVPAGLAVAA